MPEMPLFLFKECFEMTIMVHYLIMQNSICVSISKPTTVCIANSKMITSCM